MCGIFGGVLKTGEIAPLIHDGLKRLEYRGYDSVGFATIQGGALQVSTASGDRINTSVRFPNRKCAPSLAATVITINAD